MYHITSSYMMFGVKLINKNYVIYKSAKSDPPSLQLPNHMNKEDHLTQGF